MRAVTVADTGVQILDVDMPKPKSDDVLVKVHACGLNRADLVVADGGAHGAAGGAGTIVGMEFSGEVVECGDNVKNFSIGDRVMCSGSSTWAEFAIADYGRVIKIPDNNMDFTTASTLPVALATMHNAIVTIGEFVKGQTVLIQGASSGVGLMGLQIAKHLGAQIVIGTSFLEAYLSNGGWCPKGPGSAGSDHLSVAIPVFESWREERPVSTCEAIATGKQLARKC